MKAPVIVNCGLGVDSVAVLVGKHARGEPVDLILFADTGGEKPETYAYLPVLNEWLRERGMPEVTVVKYRPTRATYDTLEGNCVANETLPSIAFRGGGPGSGGCSLKFKADVMDAWLEGTKRGPWKGEGWCPLHEARAAGLRPVKVIGYDDSDADRKRTAKALLRPDDGFDYEYPLQAWGWTRERCTQEIAAAGLPVPVKSACFFCPASKRWEIKWLAAVHPELFLRAIAMEDRAAAGKHGLGEKRGLGIRFRWRAYAEAEGFLAGAAVVGDRDALLASAFAEKPAWETRAGCADADDADDADELVQIGRAA